MSHIPRTSTLATQGYNKPSARLGLRRPLADSANAASDTTKDVLKADPTKPSFGFRTRSATANAGALKPSALGAKQALRKAAAKPSLKEEIVKKEVRARPWKCQILNLRKHDSNF